MSGNHDEICSVDIMYILENPWEKLQWEWKLDSESERQETLQFIKDLLKLAQQGGYSKIWKTPDSEPLAIVGGYKVEDKKYATFFVSSKHMEEYGMQISFDMRKIAKELAVQFKGCSISQYAEADDTDRISWYRFLGYKHKPEKDIGNRRYFEYASPE
ncbi:hypothetical protein [Eudoraea adriatica]|uniref:hypothetical protein n=1 Tax=Eudoraea adriatica TaxID=446681 RepID=UPI00035F401F|nr:hypothetical protein [Eudoraea adriatica]